MIIDPALNSKRLTSDWLVINFKETLFKWNIKNQNDRSKFKIFFLDTDLHGLDKLEDILKQIRHFINGPRKQYNLIKNLPYWFQLCASLDAIEDTKLAIDSFVAIKSEKDVGRLYLLVYGALQALFLQQDAINNLCEALEIPVDFGKYPKLQDIKNLRNIYQIKNFKK